MNAIGIALVWCVAQVTLFSLLATSLYLAVRRLRPAAAATVVLTGMMIVILLSLSARRSSKSTTGTESMRWLSPEKSCLGTRGASWICVG